MRRYLLLGAGGMLATSIEQAAAARGVSKRWTFLSEQALDITDDHALARAIEHHQPSVIVNAAGFTDVRGAQTQREECYALNTHGVASLAGICAASGIRIVHVSTDYVFAGDRRAAYREDDPTGALNVYGQSKLDSEIALAKSDAEHLIVRTAWLFAAHGTNFVRFVAGGIAAGEPLKIANDQTGSPTSADDLAGWILDLIAHDTTGLVHAVNSGHATWFNLACEVARAMGVEATIEPCRGAEFDPTTLRPAYSVLNTDRLTGILGRRPRPWPEAVAEVVGKMAGVRSVSRD